MGAITDRSDKFVRRIMKAPALAPQAPVFSEAPKRRKVSILDDLAARRRQLLKRKEGL